MPGIRHASENLTLAGFAAAGAVALSLAAGAYWVFERQSQATAWILHTQEVRAAAARLRSDLAEDGKPAAESDLAALRALTRDNPSQQQRLADIERMLATAQSASAPALRQWFAAFDAEEKRLLDRRVASREAERRSLLAVAILAVLVLCLTLAVLYRTVRRRHAEARAREATERVFEMFVDNVVDYALVTLDPDGRVRSWNSGAERIKGYAAAEIVGRNFSVFYTPEDIAAGRPAQMLERASAEGHYEQEGWRLRKDGSQFWASVVITALHDEQGRLLGFGKVVRDLTERKRQEDALEELVAGRTRELSEAKERLEALSKRVIETQEEERKRISRELHDETGQALTAIRLRLNEAMARSDPRSRLIECVAIVDQAIAQIRTIAVNLRPLMLDDLGLADALEWALDQQARGAGWCASMHADEMPPLDPNLQTACYRIGQEALTNAARHAQASEVRIELRVRPGRLELSIADNGRGFSVDEFATAEERRKHLGLVSMAERASLAGGQVDIYSVPGEGTRVQAAFPLALEPA